MQGRLPQFVEDSKGPGYLLEVNAIKNPVLCVAQNHQKLPMRCVSFFLDTCLFSNVRAFLVPDSD